MEIREFLGRDSHAKSKKTCRPFEFRYNQLDGNDFLRSIPSDTSRVLPQVMKSTSISAQIFFAYQRASIVECYLRGGCQRRYSMAHGGTIRLLLEARANSPHIGVDRR